MVVAGGCTPYPGSATLVIRRASPLAVADLRVAGEGDLLARDRRACAGGWTPEDVLAPQKHLPRPLLPRTIWGGDGRRPARRSGTTFLAALARRGWAGRLVWGFAPGARTATPHR